MINKQKVQKKVANTAIDNLVNFHGAMKFSEH